MNLGIIILYVNDIEKSKAFYTGVLGMKVVEKLSGPAFIALRSEGGSLLALQDKKSPRVPAGQDAQISSIEVSFEVDDVDAIWEQWQKHEVEIVTAPMDMPFGRYFMARDTEGYFLSVYRLAS